jgi:hypothetical protein
MVWATALKRVGIGIAFWLLWSAIGLALSMVAIFTLLMLFKKTVDMQTVFLPTAAVSLILSARVVQAWFGARAAHVCALVCACIFGILLIGALGSPAHPQPLRLLAALLPLCAALYVLARTNPPREGNQKTH